MSDENDPYETGYRDGGNSALADVWLALEDADDDAAALAAVRKMVENGRDYVARREQWAVMWLPAEPVGMVCRLFATQDEAVEFIRIKLAASGNYEKAQLGRVVAP